VARSDRTAEPGVGHGERLAAATAGRIREGFDTYAFEFASLTKRAKWRFQTRDWKGIHEDALERLDLYEKVLTYLVEIVTGALGDRLHDEALWTSAKREFDLMIRGRHDAELAETFFNSVTRRVFHTVGINRHVEFFSWYPRPVERPPGEPVFRTYSCNGDTREVFRKILQDLRFTAPYQDRDRDADLVASEVDLYLYPILAGDDAYRLEVIRSPFFRNKAAYLVGRIVAKGRVIPLVLPLYNGEQGVFVDTVLLSEEEVSKVASFAFSYFHVLVERHDQVIAFLRSILPEKPVAELYNSLGYNHHGKTEFYRDLHRFMHRSRELFVIAPGKEGAVMSVFTLPDFNFVFKVIKDRPCFLRSPAMTDKTTTRREVVEQYALVCRRDRVGRLVDTQDFEGLRFRRERFDPALLDELRVGARDTVEIGEDHVVIRQLYVQRKVTPLPLFFAQERHPEVLRRIVLDFGYFLKDLAATGMFPSDLFNTSNYGVTRRGRIVLFDYDDVIPLERASFLEKPQPLSDADEWAPEEDRIVATALDFFIDEMRSYSGVPQRLKGVFELVHADLFTVDFWRQAKERLGSGELVDITPYDRSRKFRH